MTGSSLLCIMGIEISVRTTLLTMRSTDDSHEAPYYTYITLFWLKYTAIIVFQGVKE
jgi:hypothetical protein